jgi:hypothetical protein
MEHVVDVPRPAYAAGMPPRRCAPGLGTALRSEDPASPWVGLQATELGDEGGGARPNHRRQTLARYDGRSSITWHIAGPGEDDHKPRRGRRPDPLAGRRLWTSWLRQP